MTKERMESYTVLARKWRPQVFDDVVGQSHVTTTLKNALSQGRVGQGYVFIGTRGVGKTTIARILAKALNCLSTPEPTPTPCGTCDNCVAIRNGTSLDVHEIDGASNRGIEEIRRLRDSVAIAPVSSRYKVYIIDEVHMLTREAFNALLKTLEEPPAHVKFFFATTEPHKIPATILSRVQKFELRRVSWETLYGYIEEIAEKESVSIQPGALALITRAGNGSVRDALSVFDQVLAVSEDEITEEQIFAMLGWTDRDLYVQLHKACVAHDAGGALDVVKQVMEKGRDPVQFVNGLLQFLRNLLIAGTVESPEKVIEDTPENIAFFCESASAYTRAQLMYAIDALLALLPRLEATEAKQTALELAVLKVLDAGQRVSVDQIFARLDALETGSTLAAKEAHVDTPALVRASSASYGADATQKTGQDTPEKPRKSSVTDTSESLRVEKKSAAPATDTKKKSVKTLSEAWSIWLERLSDDDPKLYSIYHPARMSIRDDTVLVLCYPPEDSLRPEAARVKENMRKTAAALSDMTGKSITIEVEQDAAPVTQKKAKKALSQEELIEKAKQDPLVQKALELFPGSTIESVEEDDEE